MSDDFRAVGGSGIDDNDFIKDVFDALEAFGQGFFLIFHDHAKGEFHGSTSKKKYILFIEYGICGCGGLIRGLENLESFKRI